MAKIRTALSLLGSAKDAKKFATRFDDPSRHLQPESLFPPEDVRPAVTEARTLLLRVTNAGDPSGDIFTVVHVPASRDGIAVFVFNPNIVVEADSTLRELVDDAGYPVDVAIVETFLGARIDHVAELTMEALARVVDAVGPLATYSRASFSSHGVEFTEGTNHLDGAATSVFAAADPVDDAGQTRTRNQRAIIRALVNKLDLRKLAKDNTHVVQLLAPLVDGTRKDPGLTSNTLVQLAADLRGIARTHIVTVTVPAASERQQDGTVRITFEADVVDALRDSLTAGQSGEFAAKLADMGY